jgi:hypothetical protein
MSKDDIYRLIDHEQLIDHVDMLEAFGLRITECKGDYLAACFIRMSYYKGEAQVLELRILETRIFNAAPTIDDFVYAFGKCVLAHRCSGALILFRAAILRCCSSGNVFDGMISMLHFITKHVSTTIDPPCWLISHMIEVVKSTMSDVELENVVLRVIERFPPGEKIERKAAFALLTYISTDVIVDEAVTWVTDDNPIAIHLLAFWARFNDQEHIATQPNIIELYIDRSEMLYLEEIFEQAPSLHETSWCYLIEHDLNTTWYSIDSVFDNLPVSSTTIATIYYAFAEVGLDFSDDASNACAHFIERLTALDQE